MFKLVRLIFFWCCSISTGYHQNIIDPKLCLHAQHLEICCLEITRCAIICNHTLQSSVGVMPHSKRGERNHFHVYSVPDTCSYAQVVVQRPSQQCPKTPDLSKDTRPVQRHPTPWQSENHKPTLCRVNCPHMFVYVHIFAGCMVCIVLPTHLGLGWFLGGSGSPFATISQRGQKTWNAQCMIVKVQKICAWFICICTYVCLNIFIYTCDIDKAVKWIATPYTSPFRV